MPSSKALLETPTRLFLYIATPALLIFILARGQVVLVPLALAAMTAFVLNTPVSALEARGVPRMASVAAALLVTLALLAAFGYALTRQFRDFATLMPKYAASIKTKLGTLHDTRKSVLGKIEDTVEKVSHDLDKQDKTSPGAEESQGNAPVQSVSVVPVEPSEIERLRGLLEPVFRPIATAGGVLVLTGFMLMRREDLRNRLIRLAGQGQVTVTTRTLDEAGYRISTFLFAQSLINAAFGVCIAVGLLVIGVPYALLWGGTAALLRFVPYLGALLALLMPAALAFVGSPGWAATVETIGLFLVLDALTANLIEPVLIGAHTGISSFALLVTTMFWTCLWGPAGLLLSTPLTVCLAAAGKHVRGLAFLDVLLGDEPPLEPDVTLYQRLLAGDEDEASDILDQELGKDDVGGVFDRVVAPALIQAGRDRLRDDISDAEQLFVVRTIDDILRQRLEAIAQPETRTGATPPHRRSILGVPARNETDALALAMLSHVLDDSWVIEQLTTVTLASEVLQAVERMTPDVLCITALPPGGLNHIRYLCKRIHSQFPDLPICVLRPDAGANPSRLVVQLGSDAMQHVATSFAAAATHLAQHIFHTAESAPEGGNADHSAAAAAADAREVAEANDGLGGRRASPERMRRIK